MREFARRHPLFWSYLFFCYFSLTYQLLIYASGMSGTVGVRQALLMSVLWLIPLLLWPRYSRIMAAIIGIVLWAAASVAIGYWLIYGQDFSQSVIFVIFESNLAEGTEFIQSYLRGWHVAVFAAFAAVPVLLWRWMSPLALPAKTRYRYAIAFTLLVSWPFLNVLLIKNEGFDEAVSHLLDRLEPAAPWNLAVAYLHYQSQLATMESLLASNHEIPPLPNFETDATALPETLVLVIGESTNSKRMGLYGYPRDTTPQLDALRDELVVFNDVVTSRPYTIEALQMILSFANSQHPDDFFTQPNLLNIMKQAGYEITWITNQQTQTRRNNMLTMLSQLADRQIYLNNNRAQNAEQYDGVVLEPFLQTLAEPAPRKMIVVHLLGTHRKYDYRYPDEFVTFTDAQDLPVEVDSANLAEYNSYDDAIRYNDSVLAQLINGVKAHSDDAMLVYFADHGEEVYDYPASPFSGRNEALPTPAMYTVPFIVWSSPQADNKLRQAKWQSYANRPFSTTDFIYAYSEMVGVSYDGLDYSRSLVSDRFIRHPRWIGDPGLPDTLQDYDQIDWQQQDGIVTTTASNGN